MSDVMYEQMDVVVEVMQQYSPPFMPCDKSWC